LPILIAIAVILAAFALTALMLPFAIVFRYRAGTKRRRARAWIATINLVSLAISTMLFMVTAAITNGWIPHALSYSSAGLAAGCLLGILGLVLTRWEPEGPSLFYKPSRLLVLTISLVVTARLCYGLWRAWQAWQATPDQESWLAAAGVAGSMGAGAVVLGYYLMYWAGLRLRIARSSAAA
jgi:hypothetical protein